MREHLTDAELRIEAELPSMPSRRMAFIIGSLLDTISRCRGELAQVRVAPAIVDMDRALRVIRAELIVAGIAGEVELPGGERVERSTHAMVRALILERNLRVNEADAAGRACKALGVVAGQTDARRGLWARVARRLFRKLLAEREARSVDGPPPDDRRIEEPAHG